MTNATTRLISARLEHALIDAVDEAAKREGVSRAAWIARALAAALAGPAEPAALALRSPQEPSGRRPRGRASRRPPDAQAAARCPECGGPLEHIPRWPRRWWCDACRALRDWTP